MNQTRFTRRGFSLIELVIVVVIIAIIAAIAVPKMSRGAAGANDAATLQNLSQMRSAIDMFTTEHGGTPPASVAATFTSQLTQFSDLNGTAFSATKTTACVYGPYLKAIPALSVGVNKGSAVVSFSAPVGTGTAGWYYDGTTIYANLPPTGADNLDAKGVAYNTY